MTLLAAALCAVTTATANEARAYCRESLESQSQGPCVDNPNALPLYWNRGCMSYVFNNRIFAGLSPKLDETATRSAFAASYETWAKVPCGTRRPFFVHQTSGTTTTTAAEFVYDQPNEGIVVLRSRSEWSSLEDHDSNAIALTLLWHDKHTGEILDVDMELNGGAGMFSDCQKQTCVTPMIDLQNTITHEAGHLLGLGHSTVGGSTMQASTSSSPETTKRTLAEDDEKGYCALDLPEWSCQGAGCTCPEPPVFPSRRTVQACGCRIVGASDGVRERASALGGMALAGAWAYRRRRRRQLQRT